MTILHFPYTTKTNIIVGQITRPTIQIDWYSSAFNAWLRTKEALVDTGADFSVIPFDIGRLLVPQVESGLPIRMGSVSTLDRIFDAYLHRVNAQIGNFRFEMPVAITTPTQISVILGGARRWIGFLCSL